MPTAREGESTRGLPLSSGGLGTRFQSRFFARKDISWRVRKPNTRPKQNRFQIVTIFYTFFFSIFLRHYVTYVPAGFGKVLLVLIIGCHGRIQRGDRGSGPPPPLKNHKNRVSKQYWSGSPEKSLSYQASIQCWANIGPPASDITFGIRAWLYFKELYFRKDIHKRLFN